MADPPADPLAVDFAAFASYLEHEQRASPRTVEHYLRDLETLGTFVRKHRSGKASIGDISLILLRGWLGERAGDRVGATLSRNVSSVRAFLRYARRTGRLDKDPSALLRAPKVRRSLPDVLSITDSSRLMDTPPDVQAKPRTSRRGEPAERERLALRDCALLEMMYGSGVRVSEVIGLNLADVDLRHRTALVRGKGSKERIVPLGRQAVVAVGAYLFVRSLFRHPKTDVQDPEAMFLGRHGTRLTPRQVQYQVATYGATATGRPDVHPHTLRHACATHLLDAGADLRMIQELLGHASVTTTQRYTHVSMEKIMAVYDKAHPLARGAVDVDGDVDGDGTTTRNQPRFAPQSTSTSPSTSTLPTSRSPARGHLTD